MWKIEYDEHAVCDLKKLDKHIAKRIIKYLDSRIADCDNQQIFGEKLTGNFSGLWRFRIGDYRVVAEINEEIIVVYVVKIGHRRDIYNSH